MIATWNLYEVTEDDSAQTYIVARSIQETVDYLKTLQPDGWAETEEVRIKLFPMDRAEAMSLDMEGEKTTLAAAFRRCRQDTPDAPTIVCSSEF